MYSQPLIRVPSLIPNLCVILSYTPCQLLNDMFNPQLPHMLRQDTIANNIKAAERV